MGSLHYFLGIEVTPADGICLSQSMYTSDLLKLDQCSRRDQAPSLFMAHTGAADVLAFSFCCRRRGHRFGACGSYPAPSTARRSQRNLCPSLWQTVDQQATAYAVLEEEGTKRPPRTPCWSRPPRTPSLCMKTRTKAAPSTTYAVEPAITVTVEPVIAKKLGGRQPRLAATKLCQCS
jgi:hypothetical protein